MSAVSKVWKDLGEQAVAERGSGFAVRRSVISVDRVQRRRSQRGVTLIEVLIVLLVLGFLVAIVMPAVGGAIQRARIDTQAQEIRNFLVGAYARAGEQRAPVAVRLEAPPAAQRWLRITREIDGTGVLAEMRIPQWVSLSTTDAAGIAANWPQPGGDTTVYVLQCDPMGRTLHPVTGTQVREIQSLILTHRNMVAGRLEPRYRYEVRVFPIWQVQVERSMW